jgi:hypothetical protein
MFCYDKVGAQASANLYSLVMTARANRVEPFEYLSEQVSGAGQDSKPLNLRESEHLALADALAGARHDHNIAVKRSRTCPVFETRYNFEDGVKDVGRISRSPSRPASSTHNIGRHRIPTTDAGG